MSDNTIIVHVLRKEEWPHPDTLPSCPRQGEIVDTYVYDVYDGDTVSGVFDLSGSGAYMKISFRIEGIDTPEKKPKIPKRKSYKSEIEYQEALEVRELEKKAGMMVGDYVRDLLVEKVTRVKIIGWDKYGGRMVGEVYNPVVLSSSGGEIHELLKDRLLDWGLCKPYTGKVKKEEWTRAELEAIINKLTE